MKNEMTWWGIFFFLFLLAASRVSAITVGVSSPPAVIDQNQEVSLDVFLSCNSCSDSYLRGVFFEAGDNYFGETLNNNGEWIITSSDRTKYFRVSKEEITESSWSGTLKVRVDLQNSYYKGPGEYSLKLGRYTASAGSSATWSDTYKLHITGPSPTPKPSSTPTPTVTPVPTKMPTMPTGTPTKQPTTTATTTPTKPSVSVTPGSSGARERSPAVMGISEENTSSPSVFARNNSRRPFIISLLLVAWGCAILAGFYAWKIARKRRPPEEKQE